MEHRLGGPATNIQKNTHVKKGNVQSKSWLICQNTLRSKLCFNVSVIAQCSLFGLSLHTKDLYLMMSLNLINLQALAGCPFLSQRPRNG